MPSQPSPVPQQSAIIDSLRLDRDSTEPFWRQLYSQIVGLLQSGALGAGNALPSERDLSAALGVSRSTIKRCYDELRQQRQLGGRGRSGSIIRTPERAQPTLGRLKGFTEEMRELGRSASTQVVRREVVTDRAMASLFGQPSTARFLHLIRIRLGDDLPMTREIAWYDLSLAPGLQDWDGQGSAYALLQERCHLRLSEAEQTVEAVLSSEAETLAFGFAQPQPCLLFKRKTRTRQGQLIEYVEGTFRGDAYVYRLTLKG